jgi:predicted nucleic acid-binding protein
MPAVSNTSPLLSLAIINQQHLLQQQFGDILIPPAVWAELRTDTGLPGTDALRAALEADWLRVIELQDIHLAQTLGLNLDAGGRPLSRWPLSWT